MAEPRNKAASASKTASERGVVPLSDDGENTFGSKVATVAVIGLGVALIEAELIPGMLIGAAAVLAPNLLPKLGNALRPLIKTTVKAGYALASKTRETMAEAGEQLQDMVAEAKAEAGDDTAVAPASSKAAPAHKTA